MTTHLRPVPNEPEKPGAVVHELVPERPPSRLPAFEGLPVDLARVKLSGVTGLDVGEEINHIDDIVKFYVEGRVTRVDHVVDETSGRVIRVHTIKALEAIQLPYDFDADLPQ